MTRHAMSSAFIRWTALLVLTVAIVAAFTAIQPKYATYHNFSAVTRHMAATGLCALGLTFVVVVRRFDLSFAGTASFAGMTVGFIIASGHGLGTAVAAGLLAGTLVGVLNGLAVSYAGLPDIVTTIATGSIAGGAAFLFTGGRTIFQHFMTSGIIGLNDMRFGGLNVSVYFLLALYGVSYAVLHRSRFGAAFYAVGENPTSAYFSGVAVRRYTTAAFAICAAGSVLAVVLLLAESGTADTHTGANFLMPAYAAVYLGAALLGRASVPATLAGTLLITVLLDGFSLLGVPYYYSDGVVSTILLAGILLFDERLKRGLAMLAGLPGLNRRLAAGARP